MKTIKFFAVLTFLITLNSCEPESLEDLPYKTEKGKADSEYLNKEEESFDENMPNLIEETSADTKDQNKGNQNTGDQNKGDQNTEDQNTGDQYSEDEDRGNG